MHRIETLKKYFFFFNFASSKAPVANTRLKNDLCFFLLNIRMNYEVSFSVPAVAVAAILK